MYDPENPGKSGNLVDMFASKKSGGAKSAMKISLNIPGKKDTY